jgi:NIMA (never in mitosis gene a)-related kinase
MLSSNKTSLLDFEILKAIGKGSFSQVYLVKRKKDSKIYALKSVYLEMLEKKQQESSINEVRILASVQHPNVISYKEAFWDDNTNSLNIVMEYADDGDLYTKIKKMKEQKIIFDEKIIWEYSIQIIQGLKALHDKNIMHRDLKSENIFITKNNRCKIGDMNVSKVLKEKLLNTQTGTPYYASPEVWMNKPYSYKSDLWSIGCVIYEMCELKTPFPGKDMEDLFVNICLNKVERINKIYSDELWYIIKKLLEVNVDKRFDCRQFLNNDIVKRKINELKKNDDIFNNNNINLNDIQEDSNNSFLLNTFYFNDINDIKKQLPNKKYYNDESTTESNSKKKKNNFQNNKDISIIKELRKELENVKFKQELRKKEKNLSIENKRANNNLEKNRIKQKIKNWDIKLKNIKFKNIINDNKKLKYKLLIPNNFIHKHNKIIKRYQNNDLSQLNIYNKSAFSTNLNNYSNISIDNQINSIDKHNSFYSRNLNEDNKKNNSISYNKENTFHSKIAEKKNNSNYINTKYIHSKRININSQLYNKLKFLNYKTSEINKYKIKIKKNNDKFQQRNIYLSFIPNNYQRYINNSTNSNERNNIEISNNKTNIESSAIPSMIKFMNMKSYKNIKISEYSKNNKTIFKKSNSYKKLLNINIDSKIKRIKALLKRNKNFQIGIQTGKTISELNNNLSNNKSFSQRVKKFDIMDIYKKKLIHTKNNMINKIPKCNMSKINRNNLKIPYYFKPLKTCVYKVNIHSNINYFK